MRGEKQKIGPFGKLPRRLPACHTVGELKAVLAQLPDDLPINGTPDDMDSGVKPVVFNQRYEDCQLGLEDNDGTWD